MKVLIVDDHAVVREGLKHILAGLAGVVEIGEAGSAAEAMDKARHQDWDVALVDIALPGRTGMELLKQLRQEKPALPVLVLSMFPEEQYAVRVLRAGARGYLNKESAPEQLLVAIEAVKRGERYVSARVVEQLAAAVGPNGDKPRHQSLSNRELTVLRLLASGYAAREIAEKLCLSIKTVSTYRSRVLAKLDIRNNSQLIAYAIRNQLVD